jgi:hypothetical protein
MEIINNLSSNHMTVFKNLADKSDELFLASPFLFSDFDDFFEILNLNHLSTITLITTLHAEINDLSRKTNSLVSFVDSLDKAKIKWNVHIDNKLHGKIYIFKTGNKATSGIISSANLTDNGMTRNHEWGVLITDEKLINKIELELISCVEKKNLTQDNIIELMLKTDEYSKNASQENKEKIIVDIKDILNNQVKVSFAEETKFLIKPIGVQDEPVEIGRDFSEESQKLYFSKRRPVAVCLGDILICYGVGQTKLLSYFKVITEPKIRTDEPESRWPWVVDGKNLSSCFGKKWWDYDYTLSNLQVEFKEKNPDTHITYKGGDTLGALNFGSDKIRLTQEFAEFLITKIYNSL